jgi:hypothetical protein
MKPTKILSLLSLCLTSVGCTSIGSTHIERAKELCGWNTTHLHGIPITLEVPHHYEIQIVETYYELGGALMRDSQTKSPIVTRKATFQVKNTKEIFTVDFVRPAAGTLDTSLTLDPKSEYFTKIDNKLTDTTIKDITAAITTISAAANPLLARDALNNQNAIQHDKIVAEALIEVADPDAKQKIHAFLCEHLNGCTNCSTKGGDRPATPDVMVTSTPIAPATTETLPPPMVAR